MQTPRPLKGRVSRDGVATRTTCLLHTHLHHPAFVSIATSSDLLHKHRAALVLCKHHPDRLAQRDGPLLNCWRV